MKIFAIGDLHLSHTGEKPMDIFGAHWRGHAGRIAENWAERVDPGDLVLVPGDLSWGMRMEDAEEDLRWLDGLPGKKIIIKGNHDYWWPSISKLRQRLTGTSIIPLQYDSAAFGSVAVGGTRLWNMPDLEVFHPDPLEQIPGGSDPAASCEGETGGARTQGQDEKIFRREMGRLEQSLKSMDPQARMRIVMTHFPPTDEWGAVTVVTRLLEKYGVQICAFGHLHNLSLPRGKTWDFVRNGIRYVLVSCDAIQFAPYLLTEAPES